MSHRFFLDAKPTTDSLVLEGDQAHHAIHVMRFGEGDEITLFDGTGVEYRSVIDEVAKKRLTVRIVERIENKRAVKTKVALAVALPKGDRQKFLIEKLVELGVDILVPLKTTRSVAVANEKVIQRLKKQVVEASKQCGRNTLMTIESEMTIKSLADSPAAVGTKIIADPYDGPAIGQIAARELESVVVAVGPEGGFSDAESALAHALGFESVKFGPSILRVETAALVAASIFGIGREV